MSVDAAAIFLVLNFVPLAFGQGEITAGGECMGGVDGSKFEIYDGTCQKYYFCISDGAALVRYNLTCTGTNVFNGDTCVSPFDFVCEQTTLTPPTTTAAVCVTFGRFAVVDPNCQKYYFCFWDGAKYTRWDLKCPNTLRFNSMIQKCVSQQNYICTGNN